VRTKLRLTSNEFSELDSARWQSSNQALEQVEWAAEKAMDIFWDEFWKACDLIPNVLGVNTPEVGCKWPLVIVRAGLIVVYFAVHTAHQISLSLYNDLIDNVNGDATDDILASTYENIIVVHHNLLTTFKKLELVQSMLGDLGDDDNDESRRLQEEEECKDTATCHKDNSRCNCDDKEFNCDCTPNYDFLKIQSGAGCDQFDSDGDTFIDNCEDSTAPRLILKDPNQFQCDLTNLDKLCYNRNTFMEFGHAQTYLLANVQIIDDCADKDQLRINVTETKKYYNLRSYL
jgi:hypothetical protein